jgi:hypothetical protein
MGDNPMMQVKVEGQPAFEIEPKGNDNPSDSSPDTNEADQTGASNQDNKDGANKDGGSDSKDFHKDPRWIERENDWKIRFNEQEVRHTSELTKAREDLEQKIAAIGKPAKNSDEVPADVPSWFEGDEFQWKDYAGHTQQLIDKAVEKALSTIQERIAGETRAIEDATKWFNDEVAAIEADKELNPQGLKVDRNKLLKTALDNKAVDIETGKWNYRLAFKLMKPSEVFQAKRDLNEKRNIAGATTSENRAETKSQPFMTTKDFKNPSQRPW